MYYKYSNILIICNILGGFWSFWFNRRNHISTLKTVRLNLKMLKSIVLYFVYYHVISVLMALYTFYISKTQHNITNVLYYLPRNFSSSNTGSGNCNGIAGNRVFFKRNTRIDNYYFFYYVLSVFLDLTAK